MTPGQSTDWKDIHKIDIFIAHHSQSKQRPRRHEAEHGGQQYHRRPSSPLPDTSKRGVQARRERQRDERDERRDADVEASTSRQTHGRSQRMRRHRHGHDDITEQASRENGLIIPPRLTTRQAGSKAGRGEMQIAGNRNGGGSEKVISARAVLTSSSQTTEDNRGRRDDARHGMTATEPKPTPLHQDNEAEPH